jgi:hypothetical protein
MTVWATRSRILTCRKMGTSVAGSVEAITAVNPYPGTLKGMCGKSRHSGNQNTHRRGDYGNPYLFQNVEAQRCPPSKGCSWPRIVE